MPVAVEIGFLKVRSCSKNQPDEVLKAALVRGEVKSFGPGAVVFQQGQQQGDCLYIVKSGLLEVLATPTDRADAVTLAYLGPAEVIGEMALLTGSPRSASVRSPEHAQLFTLERPVFLDLMESLPSFSCCLCVVLAKRLEAGTHKAPKSSSKQLQGSLKYFDVATVLQALIGSHQTGNRLAPPGRR